MGTFLFPYQFSNDICTVADAVVDKTSWFRITAFNPTDYVKERVKKGALVFVDGDVSIDKYQDEASGKTLSAIRIVQGSIPDS